MRFHKDSHEARRVDPHDYDGMCDLVAWCGGRAVDDEDHVIAMPTPAGEVYVQAGDWIIRDAKSGRFHVYRHPEWHPIMDGWPWFLPRDDE